VVDVGGAVTAALCAVVVGCVEQEVDARKKDLLDILRIDL
jgi:hypothetical protein